MTKTISIAVPEELSDKMQEWKASFNWSKVCQEAISEAIEKKKEFKERLKEGDPTMEEVIDRLQKEKQEAEDYWFNQGIKDGIDFAKAAHYSVLKEFLDTFNFICTKTTSSSTSNAICNFSEEDTFHEWANLYKSNDDEPFKFKLDNWTCGIVEGVRQFWDEVKDKL